MPPRKKPYYKKKKDYVSEAVKKYVKKAVDEEPEHKCNVDFLRNQPLDTTPYIRDLSDLPTGVDLDQRIGLKIKPVRLYGNITVSSSSDWDPDWVRFIIFRFRDDNTAAAPIMEDVVDLPAGLNADRRFMALAPAYANPGKSTVLWDSGVKSLQTPQTDYADVNMVTLMTMHYDVRPTVQVKYKDNDATGQTGTDHLYLLCVSSSSGGTHPSFSIFNNLVFTDA